MVIAILNHMPLWAGVAVIVTIIAGYLIGAWLTRDDVPRYRKRWWLP